MTKVIPGIENLLTNQYELLQGKNLGLVVNQASVFSDLHHTIDKVQDMCRYQNCTLKSVFGPQHGLWGHTQDNMIEWEGEHDRRFPFNIYSLYGKYRNIPDERLKELDVLIFDIQDVGARYYTFIWTLANVMSSLSGKDIELIVTDRPNPINAVSVEGPVLDPAFSSFVGLHPLPVRHGMTIGEIALYFQKKYYPEVNLQVIPMIGYNRADYFDDSGLPWVLPSPNMPSPATALVYPGMCLLEATNISEGRGTTLPFEIFGAPWIDGMQLCKYLNMQNIPGAFFRFHAFQPVFNKFAGEYCEGAQIHVTDRNSFKPFETTLIILSYLLKTYPQMFFWKNPPYEYEYEKMPVDILLGNGWLKNMLEEQQKIGIMQQKWMKELNDFKEIRKSYLIY